MELNLNCFCCCCSIVVMTQVFLLLFSHRRNLIYIEREMKKKIRGRGGGGGRGLERDGQGSLACEVIFGGKATAMAREGGNVGRFPSSRFGGWGSGERGRHGWLWLSIWTKDKSPRFFFNEIYFQHRELIARDMHLIISPFFSSLPRVFSTSWINCTRYLCTSFPWLLFSVVWPCSLHTYAYGSWAFKIYRFFGINFFLFMMIVGIFHSKKNHSKWLGDKWFGLVMFFVLMQREGVDVGPFWIKAKTWPY